MSDLKPDEGAQFLRRSSDASTSSSTSSSQTLSASTDQLKTYHLPYHTLDIKDSSPFLNSREVEDGEEHQFFAHDRPARRGKGGSLGFALGLFPARGRLSPVFPSSKRKLALLLVLSIILVLVLNTITHPIPPYDLIPATKYQEILNQSVSASFPAPMRQRLELELGQRLRQSDFQVPHDNTSTPRSVMPTSLFQTDKKASKFIEVERSWEQAGAHRRFLDDAGAADFIYQNFNQSQVWDTYQSLPIPVLKSDFLRYAALLAEGGIYSDMDTRVLMPVDDWWRGSELHTSRTGAFSKEGRFNATSSPPSSSAETRDHVENQKNEVAEPVRFLVGIENDSKLWHSVRNILEAFWLLPLNRHRPLQFVQWTLQSAPNHPILVDALRRIVDTSHFAKALIIEREKKANYQEVMGNLKKAEQIRREPLPWNGLRGREFERTGVEEWTGPGMFTDAVMSYLHAVSGLQISDLQNLGRPLQVRDVVILPCSGFHPFQNQLPDPMARVVHLFRGSWK